MGFLSNTANICRLQVIGNLPPADGLFQFFSEALMRHAFRPIDATIDEMSTGWTNLFDKSEFGFDNPGMFWLGDHLSFSIRQDRRKIPGAALKETVQKAFDEFLAAHPGLRRVPKQKREEIKEAVRLRLLAKTVPTPTANDVVWDLKTNVITFCNISTGAMDTFDQLFRKTFPDLRLRFITPYDVAMCCPIPADLQTSLSAANQATSVAVLDIIRSNQWLGNDLLLWLIYVQGTDGGFTCPELTAYINDRLVLTSSSETGTTKVSFVGDQDARLDEIRTSLRNGKKIIEAKIFLEHEDNVWSLTLKGDTFNFSAHKCPPVHIEKDAMADEKSERKAVFYERLQLLAEGRRLFDELLTRFLHVRLSPRWGDTAAKIDQWLHE